ncbi:MAG: YggS family pyridoxal phosphate-dependent enzyme [Proteobacteria bacterium]|nr:YggS family pyridoxal phosphate-dependent enzyme [Pseudomonadota bacterium]
MPTEITAAYARVAQALADACLRAGRKPGDVGLVAVSKTHPAEAILPVLEAGHRLFGENRVQEAKAKWPELTARFPGVELHLIGPLQSNKAAEAVALFDAIETIDRDKIAAAVAAECRKQGRKPKLFVQVNIGAEPQKAGIAPAEVDAFLIRCRNEHGLDISGLMCIPPADEPPRPYFDALAKIARRNGLDQVSMGMSQDFEEAIAAGASLVRVGSAIFGARG